LSVSLSSNSELSELTEVGVVRLSDSTPRIAYDNESKNKRFFHGIKKKQFSSPKPHLVVGVNTIFSRNIGGKIEILIQKWNSIRILIISISQSNHWIL